MNPSDVEAVIRNLHARLERVEAELDNPASAELLGPASPVKSTGDAGIPPYEHDEDSVYRTYPNGVPVVSYDFLEPGEPEAIATLLNRGVSPPWDDLKPVLEKYMREKNGGAAP